MTHEDRTPAWREGYRRGIAGKAPKPSWRMDRKLYREGFDAGRQARINKTVDLEAQGIDFNDFAYLTEDGQERSTKDDREGKAYPVIPKGWTPDQKITQHIIVPPGLTPEVAAAAPEGSIAMDGVVYPPNAKLREIDEADAFRHGYEESRDLLKSAPNMQYSAAERMAYINGYQKGMTEKINENVISVNRARELMGYHPFENPPTVEVFLSETFDPPILFDPVKIPSHYNSGTIEVTNFIADQQLNFPRGNVVKYVARAGKKDPATEIQDLEKAAAYLQMAHNLANNLPAVVRDPQTKEVVFTLFQNEGKPSDLDTIQELIKALIHTVEYVGNKTLPPVAGWSWYDALVKHAPEEAEKFRKNTPVVTEIYQQAAQAMSDYKGTEGPYYPN